MAEDRFYSERLEHAGVKATTTRVAIYRQLFRGNEMLSMGELERLLPHIDKSTIFRTLCLLLEHKLVHSEEVEGVAKYGLENTNHVHFYCTDCGKTYCLADMQTRRRVDADLEGWKVEKVSIIMKGLCPQCYEKRL